MDPFFKRVFILIGAIISSVAVGAMTTGALGFLLFGVILICYGISPSKP